mgnify:CR=1 FL=1
MRLLDVKEACEALGIGRTTLFALRRRGLLRAVKIGRRVLFDPRDLEHFIEEAKKKAARPTA